MTSPVQNDPLGNRGPKPHRGGGSDSARPGAKPAGIAAWWLYDWANSAFGTLITTFIFGPYFIASVAQDVAQGTVYWGRTLSIAALIVAILSPPLGAIADKGGGRKTWLLATTAVCVTLSALLYFVAPSSAYVAIALVIFGGAVVASEMSLVFYNSMLPALAPPGRVGMVSGWGLGIGYVGGVASLATALVLLVDANAPLAGLDKGGAENIRATALLVAAWYAVFSLPLFIFTPQQTGSASVPKEAVKQGLRTLLRTFREARRHANVIRYLVSFLFYANGVTTLFAFGGIYAVGQFGMSIAEVTKFAILLNIAAGGGAAAFSWIDDRFGPKRTIFIALTGLIISGTVLVLTESKFLLWTLGGVLGVLLGAAQATSRSFMARLTPKMMEAEMFGLYALAGKATAFAGPLVLAIVTEAFDSQRAGMATILGFFAIGFVLLIPVKEPDLR